MSPPRLVSGRGTLESDTIIARLQAGPIRGRQRDLAAMFGLTVAAHMGQQQVLGHRW